jgi:glycosyltransferase involved in cell wall biosynthesis
MHRVKTILFVNPDYHCSFLLRDELRKMGWRADVFVGYGYPKKLLYKDERLSICEHWPARMVYSLRKRLQDLSEVALLGICSFYYRYFVFYGGMMVSPIRGERLLRRVFGEDFCLFLALLKLFRRKLLYLPSGCKGEELQSRFAELDGGNVCGNCGVLKCEDSLQLPVFKVIRRYADFVFGYGVYNSTQFPMTHVKYKSLDLALWNPEIEIPNQFLLKRNGKVKVLHSFMEGGRTFNGKNIKGSPSVWRAVERLQTEGYPVEYYYVQDVESKDMRYYQVQADIIVDQLIYGWWGSTGIEGMALGKPVVCYLRREWKEHFFQVFPEYRGLPIVEASTDDIYEVLKRLVIDEGYRKRRGEEAREFAERHFDLKRNSAELEKLFLSL